jgi:phosphoribosylamine--glycine ligase
MKVMVVGGGGREHAIVWKLSQSSRISELFCAPGNAGTANLAKNIPLKATDLEGVRDFALKEKIDLVVVAPDDPLAMGMVDMLQAAGIKAFGPNAAAARIEASKAFAKNLMKKYNIPTAAYEIFSDQQAALDYVNNCQMPVVIKADGLALGKGVNYSEDRERQTSSKRYDERGRSWDAVSHSSLLMNFTWT